MPVPLRHAQGTSLHHRIGVEDGCTGPRLGADHHRDRRATAFRDFVFHVRKAHIPTLREAGVWSAIYVGIAILFLGVAASSAFVEQRDKRLEPGQSVRVDDYTLTYREPTARVRDDPAGTGAELSLGAVVDVRRGGETWTLRPQRA